MRRACLALVVLNVAGCSGRRGPPEEIVVPRGFTGPVWIVLDPDGRDTPFVNNRYQVVIPANGMLKVQSLKPLQQWHQSSARFDDGSPLPVESGGTPVGPGVVAVRGGGGGWGHDEGRQRNPVA